MQPIVVYRGRTVRVGISLGYDVSGDTISSEIRVDKDVESDLIATWVVSFLTDGTDGEIILTLDDSVTREITKSSGYMDLKRITNGEPVNVFDDPIEVQIKNTVTA